VHVAPLQRSAVGLCPRLDGELKLAAARLSVRHRPMHYALSRLLYAASMFAAKRSSKAVLEPA
jgi:hypothetical protein